MIVTLFHGTSSRHLSSIEKIGLIPRVKGGNYGKESRSHKYVYLTRYYPVLFGCNALNRKDERIVLVRTQIDMKDLMPDEDFVAYVKCNGIEKTDKDRMSILHKVGRSSDPKDYKEMAKYSYDLMGNVCVERVSRESITGILEIPTRDFNLLSFFGADTNYTACVGDLSSIVGGTYFNRLEDIFKYGWTETVEKIIGNLKLMYNDINGLNNKGGRYG